jgi:hypothetical protein
VSPFSSFVLDRFIATGVSAFKQADIPDMSECEPQSGHWVNNHFLNSVLRGGFEHPISAYVHNYMRRAEGAFVAHAEARRHSQRFIELEGQAPGAYARALSQWEIFLTDAWQAEAILMKLIEKVADETYRVFEKGDGSIGERLHLLYNAMKHSESRIASGQMPEEGLVPVWLTNEGLQSTDGFLTFVETGEILEEIAHWANVFVDPREARNKTQADGG